MLSALFTDGAGLYRRPGHHGRAAAWRVLILLLLGVPGLRDKVIFLAYPAAGLRDADGDFVRPLERYRHDRGAKLVFW